MTQSDDYRALRMVSHAKRFTSYFDYPLASQRSALIRRIQAILEQKGQNTREMRLRVATALVGRQINSFSELYAGEVQAILEDQNLEGIIDYLLSPSEQ